MYEIITRENCWLFSDYTCKWTEICVVCHRHSDIFVQVLKQCVKCHKNSVK